MMNIEELPIGSAPEALPCPHFPASFLAVIWRNWNLVSPERIAMTLQTSPENIRQSAIGMGLCEDPSTLALWGERGFVTIIRRNWHLLNYEQLLTLLDWSVEHLEFVLRTEDFLWAKLGQLKPHCPPVRYRELAPEESGELKKMRETVRMATDTLPPSGEKPFAFLHNYPTSAAVKNTANASGALRMVHAYSAPFGDPLTGDMEAFYPDSLLAAYAQQGINAIWLQGLLQTLTSWMGPREEQQELRLANLRRLTLRAAAHGIKVYLYLNDPRALPERFFCDHPEWRGAVAIGADVVACCPRVPGLLRAFRDGIADLCRAVPELGGVISISMSESQTHCLARPVTEPWEPCPRCSGHTAGENVTLVLQAICDGIADAGNRQELIAWTWGWDLAWSEEVIRRLPAAVKILCVSETGVKTESHGIVGAVADYSMSHPGPGDFARRQWEWARRYGHAAAAKIQVNNTWELSCLPWLPVPQLVRRHIEDVRRAGVDDLVLSWTLGGYPGGNLELTDISVETWIARRFPASDQAAVGAITARFSEAFTHFPFHGFSLIYVGPTNTGCADLLFAKPTGYSATMVGFPYDDLASWCGGHYPEEILEQAFAELSGIWGEALEELRLLPDSPGKRELWLMAEAAYCHWRSSWCQIRFIRWRNAGRLQETTPLLLEEIELALRLLRCQYEDSQIGFEATNHYAYTANDLLEKVLNCQWLLTHCVSPVDAAGSGAASRRNAS